MHRYAAYSRACREQAEGPFKYKHLDDDPGYDHPNEGETARLKKVKLESVSQNKRRKSRVKQVQ